MLYAGSAQHSAEQRPRCASPLTPDTPAQALPDTPTLYADHAAFVWRSLARLGVPEADREDLLQETFVVVHRTRAEYRGEGKPTSWLYGIALRIATRYHRRSVHRRLPLDTSGEQVEHHTPERAMSTRQRAELLAQILAQLPTKKRVVFVMFELEGLSCEQIAARLEVPVGTVYSRLHAARAAFAETWRQLGGCVDKRTEEGNE